MDRHFLGENPFWKSVVAPDSLRHGSAKAGGGLWYSQSALALSVSHGLQGTVIDFLYTLVTPGREQVAHG
jgi:hypothetical protein